MSTTLTYNNIEMFNVLTRRFSETAVYDESGTDLLYHKFHIGVVGYVHANSVVTVGVSGLSQAGNAVGAATTATAKEVAIRAFLLEPRKHFLMTVGGTTLLQVDPAITGNATQTPNIDLDNGPKPQKVEVSHIVGASLLRIEFDIELARLDCDNNQNTKGVLNNRWSASDMIDQDWYTTRTISGRLRVSHSGLNPQDFRSWVIPSLQPGFKRQHIGVSTTPDGLSLEYVITDREVRAAPPWPATSWEATHTTSAGTAGATAFEELNIRLTGPHYVSKLELIRTASHIAEQRMNLLAANKYVLRSGAIIDYMHESTVELRISLQTFPGESIAQYFGAKIRQVNDPVTMPGYDHRLSPQTPFYGTATWHGLFISYLQNPCDDAHQIPQTQAGLTGGGTPNYGTGTTIDYSQGTAPIDTGAEANYSQEHKSSLYTYYQVDSEYATTEHVVQLPRAAIPTTAGQDTCVFAQLTAPTTIRTVTMAAERIGEWPAIPKPDSFTDQNGIKHRSKWHQIKAQAPSYAGDGRTRQFTIDATYQWLLSRPPTQSETLLSGSLPLDNTVPADNLIHLPAVLKTDIAGPQ